MKTTEEARKCWCPFARIPGRVTGRDTPDEPDRTLGYCSQNRGMETGIILEGTRCIADECMAWRAVKGKFVPTLGPGGSGYNEDGGGYCGLAGKP